MQATVLFVEVNGTFLLTFHGTASIQIDIHWSRPVVVLQLNEHIHFSPRRIDHLRKSDAYDRRYNVNVIDDVSIAIAFSQMFVHSRHM